MDKSGRAIYEAALPQDLARLRKDERIILELSFKTGMTVGKIAKVMDCTGPNVTRQLRVSLLRLADFDKGL